MRAASAICGRCTWKTWRSEAQESRSRPPTAAAARRRRRGRWRFARRRCSISCAQKTARLSPTPLERYLQCPFQYFAGRVLRLKTAPPRPEERLDFLTQGNIVHEVLAAWWANPQDLDALFESVFARHCEEKRIPRSYHTERLRNAMLDDLRAFAADTRWPRDGFSSRTEEKFVFAAGRAARDLRARSTGWTWRPTAART